MMWKRMIHYTPAATYTPEKSVCGVWCNKSTRDNSTRYVVNVTCKRCKVSLKYRAAEVKFMVKIVNDDAMRDWMLK